VREVLLSAFNLLVGCPRDREQAARSEVRYFVGDLLADTNLAVSFPNISGLITCWTCLDPFYVVHKLQELALENPYQFRFGIRFTPLEYCVESNLEAITQTARNLLVKIDANETFRVTVRRRQTALENMEVVKAVAEEIPRTVNLDKPDKTIWVEIVGEMTGMSVLNESTDILSITSMKNDLESIIFN
jgi:tRNA acetyltransferase TAN1